MQYVLMIYQGTGWDALAEMSDDEKQAIGAEYGAVNSSPGVTPGLPLGLPSDARTVRVENGDLHTSDGPFMGAGGAIGGYLTVEADDINAAIELAARIPAARLGGAIEVRPVSTYW